MGNPPSPTPAPLPNTPTTAAAYTIEADSQPAVEDTVEDSSNSKKWTLKTREILHRVERSHDRIPVLRKIPLRAIGIILFIAFLNVIVWIAAAIMLVRFVLH